MLQRLSVRIARLLRKYRLQRRGLAQEDFICTETTPAEKDLLFELARRKAGGVAVEIGSAFGASSCFIAAGLRGRGGKLYCVDKWNIEYRREVDRIVNYLYREDGMLVNYHWDDIQRKVVFTEVGPADVDCPTYQQFLTNTQRLSDVICPIRKDSVVAAAQFDQSIDFLFIDGWHEYDGVKKDCDAWLPKVKPTGIVTFHDSGWAKGVQRVIREDVMPRAIRHANLPNLFWAVLK